MEVVRTTTNVFINVRSYAIWIIMNVYIAATRAPSILIFLNILLFIIF